MTEIILIRHGQASFGTDHYDQLSDLGYKQARWLGEHWAALDRHVDRVVMGTMARHRQTAEAVLTGLGINHELETHVGLNEYSFQGLLDPFKANFPEQWTDTGHARRDYYHNMKAALGLWMSGDIDNDGTDSWASFCDRIRSAFKFVYDHTGKCILVITSGGPKSVILADILGLDQAHTVDLTMQIKNSSTSSILYNRVNFSLDSFNDVSHLLTPDRQQHITFS